MVSIIDISDPNSFRSRLRKKRIKYLLGFMEKVINAEKKKEISICDIGGNYFYWSIFPFEKFPGITFNITLVNIEEYKIFKEVVIPNVNFSSLIADACNMNTIKDKQFDIAHSNSVIEHVGNWNRIKMMANEVNRIAKYYFIQTPNYGFPVEPHYVLPFVHWLPRTMQTKVLMKVKHFDFDKATKGFEDNRMLTKKEFWFLFKGSDFIIERFYLFPKSLIAASRIGSGGE